MKIFAALLLLASLYTIYYIPNTIYAQTRPQAVKEVVQARREAVASKTAEIRLKVASSKEAFLERRIKHASEAATRKETLKTQLKVIKDRKKATVAERLDTNLNKINETRTSNMLKHLDQMDTLVDRVEARTATASGLATSGISEAITQARDNIDSARVAVQDQATKSYPVTVTNEVTLKTEFQEARDLLLEDLKAVHAAVIDARQSVGAIFEVVAKAREAANGQ